MCEASHLLTPNNYNVSQVQWRLANGIKNLKFEFGLNLSYKVGLKVEGCLMFYSNLIFLMIMTLDLKYNTLTSQKMIQ